MSVNKQTTKTKKQTRPAPVVRNAWDVDNTGITFTEDSLTKQSMKDECDINLIMDSFTSTGMINHINPRQPQYDYAPAISFKEALDVVFQSEAAFSELPSEIRERFNHDPAQFLEFVESDDNYAEGVAMGLFAPTPDHPLPSEQSSRRDESRASETHESPAGDSETQPQATVSEQTS